MSNIILNKLSILAKHLNTNLLQKINITQIVKRKLETLIDTNDLKFLEAIIIKEDFIDEKEENLILSEIEPYMKRLRYEFDHWDDVNM